MERLLQIYVVTPSTLAKDVQEINWIQPHTMLWGTPARFGGSVVPPATSAALVLGQPLAHGTSSSGWDALEKRTGQLFP